MSFEHPRRMSERCHNGNHRNVKDGCKGKMRREHKYIPCECDCHDQK